MKIKIDWKFNNVATHEDCPITGSDFKPSLGLWPFLAGTWEPIDIFWYCFAHEIPVSQEFAFRRLWCGLHTTDIEFTGFSEEIDVPNEIILEKFETRVKTERARAT